jgi:hypothetical protein
MRQQQQAEAPVALKFIDSALEKANASNKSCAMFRAMYALAASVVRVRKNDGSDEFSEPFPTAF